MKRKEFLTSQARETNYFLYLPEQAKSKLPLIVYLHGAGERGKNLEHVTRHGLAKLLNEGVEIDAAVLCPQCPADCVWDNLPHQVKALIDEIVKEYDIDEDRVTVTGSSMGGFGTWMLAMTYPNYFAAIAPVAGGGMEWRGANLVETPIRAYHGVKDVDVSCDRTKSMVDKVNYCGGKATAVYFDELGHNDGIDYAYRQSDLIDWLLSQRRGERKPVAEFCSKHF